MGPDFQAGIKFKAPSNVKHITFYLDFISPYAYLAFEALPQALTGLSYTVTYKPILFAALLKHHGQLGPAEIPGKRDWTYRQVMWLAQRQKTMLQMPAAHPFNPLGLLRLAVACKVPNRFVCETIFRHVWQGGKDAADASRLADLEAILGPEHSANSDWVKATLKSNTEAAIAEGVFGVPAFKVGDKLFWGLDALPMLRECLNGDAWFAGTGWADAAKVPVGQARRVGVFAESGSKINP